MLTASLLGFIGGFYRASEGRRKHAWAVADGADELAVAAEKAFDHALTQYRDAVAAVATGREQPGHAEAALRRLDQARFEARMAARDAHIAFRAINEVLSR